MISNSTRNELAGMTWEQLDELVYMVQNRRNILNSQAALRLHVGQRVVFEGKRGRTVTGVITAIKRSGKLEVGNCSDGCRWRMPAAMVTDATLPPVKV